MMTEEIARKLAQQIAEKILKQPAGALRDDEPLLSSGLIDSFHLMDLAMLVEDEFGVRIDDSELNPESFDTIAQLVQLIQARVKT
jgi:acyl carrier protein